MAETDIIFTVCNLIVLPLLIADGFRRLLKLEHLGPGKTLAYFGWTFFLGSQAAKRFGQMMAVVFQKEIVAASAQYTLCIVFCMALVAFLTAVLMKNVTVSVEFRDAQ